MLKFAVHWLLACFSMFWISGCATVEVVPPSQFQNTAGAISIPYRLSSVGRIIIDVDVNGDTQKPFIIDSGATVSVIYDDAIKAMALTPKGETVLVRGLVTIGRRPTIENVTFKIGGKRFPLSRVAILETPRIKDEAIGLIGADILSNYAVLFNHKTLIATFVPSKNIDKTAFKGWRKIRLENKLRSHSDTGLHFAQSQLDRRRVPVLIDTGSNTNFINWKLATLDSDLKKVERRLRRAGKLQDALSESSLTMETVFYNMIIGDQYWPEFQVTVIELDPLSDVAPVDKAMMIAGANMFTPWTVLFDFGGDMIYIHPNPNDPKIPARDIVFSQQSLVRTR